MSSRFTLTCIRCSRSVDLYQRTLKCVNCGGQLIVNYNYEAIRESVSKIFNRQISTMWKYAPLLPLLSHNHIVSLGEGGQDF
ncbi:MAG: hypothetical protein QW815_07455 [Nitrososphaerota archaeon]